MPPGAMRGRFGGRMWCRTCVQGFASVVEIQVWGRFEPETGKKKGCWGSSCERFYERAGSGEVVEMQVGKSGA